MTTIWFTGLSGAGKSTIAELLVEQLRKESIQVALLDGDIVRKTISKDLGYTKEDRDKHITRVADICALLTSDHILSIACVISPTKAIREYARNQIKKFVEVYIKCPIEICEERDVKGHYKKFRSGEIKDFVGLNVPYEAPEQPEITIDTHNTTPQQAAEQLRQALKDKGIC